METTLDASHLSRAEILARLYNASRPQGLGFLQSTPHDMTVAAAEELLNSTKGRYFDYLKGRVMKINLDGGMSRLDTWLYDRDNGPGAAARALGL